jgi:hypothetical protein
MFGMTAVEDKTVGMIEVEDANTVSVVLEVPSA